MYKIKTNANAKCQRYLMSKFEHKKLPTSYTSILTYPVTKFVTRSEDLATIWFSVQMDALYSRALWYMYMT